MLYILFSSEKTKREINNETCRFFDSVWSSLFCYHLLGNQVFASHTNKWDDIEQSYLFFGNSLNSVYHRHVARCFWLRSVTEGFCHSSTKFSKYPHDLRPSFYCLNDSFQMEKFDALVRRSFDQKLISPNISRDTQKHVLFVVCHRYLLFWWDTSIQKGYTLIGLIIISTLKF